MKVFVDTSALYALLDAADPSHPAVQSAWAELAGSRPVTHNYVVVESIALIQSRLGVAAVGDLTGGLLRPIEVDWVDRPMHEVALSSLLTTRRRGLSLVDHVSFEFMRRERIELAFAVDADFQEQGFELIPRL